jgi:mannitol-specific phosphotransferase system IIBC component
MPGSIMEVYMRFPRSLRFSLSLAAGLVVLVLVSLMLVVHPVSAKPKKTNSGGCTVAQAQAPAASRCIDQSEKDLLDNVAYPHVLICDATGVYCCQGDGSRTFGCKRLSSFQTGGSSPVYQPPGGLKVNPGH